LRLEKQIRVFGTTLVSLASHAPVPSGHRVAGRRGNQCQKGGGEADEGGGGKMMKKRQI